MTRPVFTLQLFVDPLIVGHDGLLDYDVEEAGLSLDGGRDGHLPGFLGPDIDVERIFDSYQIHDRRIADGPATLETVNGFIQLHPALTEWSGRGESSTVDTDRGLTGDDRITVVALASEETRADGRDDTGSRNERSRSHRRTGDDVVVVVLEIGRASCRARGGVVVVVG